MVVEEENLPPPATRWERVNRLVADMQRLYGPLRISVRQTEDGLGIYIPPSRKIATILFLMLWLCGWAAGQYFAVGELWRSGFRLPGVVLIIWIIPWTLGGMGVVGPTRMDYPGTIAAVHAVARYVGEILAGR